MQGEPAHGLAWEAPGDMLDPYGLLGEAYCAPAAPPAARVLPEVAELECGGCGGRLEHSEPGRLVCAGCGLLVENGAADEPRPEAGAGRLRIVGPGSNQLQPDLYRSGCGSSDSTRKKQTYEEYVAYRSEWIRVNQACPFPLDALKLAADYYHGVQKLCVKRAQNKKHIMAAILQQSCIMCGFAPTPSDVAKFMQLPTRGIARGRNFLHSVAADGGLDINVHIDPTVPTIQTLFAALHYDGAAYQPLQEAVFRIIEIAKANVIGMSSQLRSKVAGATYVVLRRCADPCLVAKVPSLQEFCTAAKIRKNTIDRFVKDLDSYHSYFVEAYRAAGLDASERS